MLYCFLDTAGDDDEDDPQRTLAIIIGVIVAVAILIIFLSLLSKSWGKKGACVLTLHLYYATTQALTVPYDICVRLALHMILQIENQSSFLNFSLFGFSFIHFFFFRAGG